MAEEEDLGRFVWSQKPLAEGEVVKRPCDDDGGLPTGREAAAFSDSATTVDASGGGGDGGVGLVYFACLVGRRDFLPRQSLSGYPLPSWHLQRLLDTSSKTYSALGTILDANGSAKSRQELHFKRKLIDPPLRKLVPFLSYLILTSVASKIVYNSYPLLES